MTQRHFAKVLNSIDVGIAGDRLESSLLLLKVFVPSYSCHFGLFVCCQSADVDLECKNLKNPQLSSASSKSFSHRQQTGHTRHKTKCLKFSCYSSHSLVEQRKVTRTSQNQKTAVPTADSRSKVVSDNILRNNQRFRPIV